jgi:ribosome-associated toxin RatA of RatAB toxin-antitoxin module
MKAVRYRHPTPGSRIETGGAYVLVRAPVKLVRKVIQRQERYARIFPRIEQSRVISRQNGATDVYLRAPVLHGAVTLWGLVRFLAPRKQGALEIVDSQYFEGNLETFRATWRMLACGPEHTLLTMELFADLKLPLPASVITPELEWASDKAVSAVRDLAECAARAGRPLPPPPAGGAPTPAAAP